MTTHSGILVWEIPWTGSLLGYSPQAARSWTEQLNNDSNMIFRDLICLSHSGLLFTMAVQKHALWILVLSYYVYEV